MLSYCVRWNTFYTRPTGTTFCRKDNLFQPGLVDDEMVYATVLECVESQWLRAIYQRRNTFRWY